MGKDEQEFKKRLFQKFMDAVNELEDEDKRNDVLWLHTVARGPTSTAILGLMSGIAMQQPDMTWWEVLMQVRAEMAEIMRGSDGGN